MPPGGRPAAEAVTRQIFFQLVYVSSATELSAKEELIALLEESRRKNALASISGLLLYHDGNFMQLLEGEEGQVRATYARILRDPRHGGCMALIKGPVAERTFPDWSMGFRDLASPEVNGTPGYDGFMDPGPHSQVLPTDPGRALNLLRLFREKLR